MLPPVSLTQVTHLFRQLQSPSRGRIIGATPLCVRLRGHSAHLPFPRVIACGLTLSGSSSSSDPPQAIDYLACVLSFIFLLRISPSFRPICQPPTSRSSRLKAKCPPLCGPGPALSVASRRNDDTSQLTWRGLRLGRTARLSVPSIALWGR